MAKSLSELREHLLRAGVAPRHVQRYLDELADHFADLAAEGERAGLGRDEAEAAALLRLGGVEHLSRAMIEQRQLQSWSARAPWAAFGLVPLLLLAGAYFVACFILWSGWKIFLQGNESPFVPLDGFAVFYFGAGKLLYFCAPVMIGWGIGIIAARQRFTPLWPIIGCVVIALVGSAARVHASRPSIPGRVGNISMSLSLGSSFQAVSSGMLHALMILLFAVPPYLLILRLHRARRHSA
jgi:hypothetical protein